MDSHLSWIVSKYSPLWGCARVKHCYNCQKLKGFYPFADIDECTTNIDSCDVHASCNNTIGSHNCTCNSGFYGSGQECLGKLKSIDNTFLCFIV